MGRMRSLKRSLRPMDKCNTCLRPIFWALRESDRARTAIDIVPILGGDVVIEEGPTVTTYKVTTEHDPDAIYKRHVCKRSH